MAAPINTLTVPSTKAPNINPDILIKIHAKTLYLLCPLTVTSLKSVNITAITQRPPMYNKDKIKATIVNLEHLIL